MSREIYISYADKDLMYAARVRNGLFLPSQRLNLAIWDQRDTVPGAQWRGEMKKHLALSAFFVALVSRDFFVFERCNEEGALAQELAQRGKLHIISIVVRPCLFEYSELFDFPYLPKGGKAITEYPNQDQAWKEVLRDLIEMLRSPHAEGA